MLLSLEKQISGGVGLVRATSIDVDALARNLSARMSHAIHHLLHGAGKKDAPDLLDFIEACRIYDLTIIPRFGKRSEAVHGLMIRFNEQYAIAASQLVYLRERDKTEGLLSMLPERGISLSLSQERMQQLRLMSELPYENLLEDLPPINTEIRKVGHAWVSAALEGKWLGLFSKRTVNSGPGELVVLRSNEERYDAARDGFVPKRHNKVLISHPDGSYDKIAYDNITAFRTEVLNGISDPASIPEIIGDGIAVWGMPATPDQTERDASPQRRLKDFQMRTFTSADSTDDPFEARRAARRAANLFWSLPQGDRLAIVDAMEQGGVSLGHADRQVLCRSDNPSMTKSGLPTSSDVRSLIERVFDPVSGIRLEITRALLPSVVRPPQGNSVFFVDMDKLPLSVMQEGLSLDAFIKAPEPHLRKLIDTQFPPEFHGVRFGAKFSSSMGLSKAEEKIGDFGISTNDDQFSVHLFFILETPVSFDGLMHHIHAHQRDHILPAQIQERLSKRRLNEDEIRFGRAIMAAVRNADRSTFVALSDAYLNGDLPRFDDRGRITAWAKLTDAERKAHRRDRSGIAHIDMALKTPNQPFFGALSRCFDAKTGRQVPTPLEKMGGRKVVSVEGHQPYLKISASLARELSEARIQPTREHLVRETQEIALMLPASERNRNTPSVGDGNVDLAVMLSGLRNRHAPQIGGIDSFNAPLFRYAIAAWGQIIRDIPSLPMEWNAPEVIKLRTQLLELIYSDIRQSVARGADPAKASQYINGKFEQESFRKSWEYSAKSAGRLAVNRQDVNLAVLREHFQHQTPSTRRALLSAFMAQTAPQHDAGTDPMQSALRKTKEGNTVLFDFDAKTTRPQAMLVIETTEIMRVHDDRNSHVFFFPAQQTPCKGIRVHGDIDSAMKTKSLPDEAIAVAVMVGNDPASIADLGRILTNEKAPKIIVDATHMKEILREVLGQDAERVELRPTPAPRAKLAFPKGISVSRSLPGR